MYVWQDLMRGKQSADFVRAGGQHAVLWDASGRPNKKTLSAISVKGRSVAPSRQASMGQSRLVVISSGTNN